MNSIEVPKSPFDLTDCKFTASQQASTNSASLLPRTTIRLNSLYLVMLVRWLAWRSCSYLYRLCHGLHSSTSSPILTRLVFILLELYWQKAFISFNYTQWHVSYLMCIQALKNRIKPHRLPTFLGVLGRYHYMKIRKCLLLTRGHVLAGE